MTNGVIIISDDMVFVQLISSLIYIRLEHVIVTPCKTYQELDNQMNTLSVALVLIDGKISTMSGIEVTRYLRMTKEYIMPIWFFPEIVNESYIYKVKEMGANRMVYRPFDPYVIVSEIESLLSPLISTSL
jgi:DNA-binding response OmpR family regulator